MKEFRSIKKRLQHSGQRLADKASEDGECFAKHFSDKQIIAPSGLEKSMKRIVLGMTLLMSSVLAFSAKADTTAKTFKSAADYVAFLKANPKVKVIAVTPIVSSTDHCPNSSNYCFSADTKSLIVTIDE